MYISFTLEFDFNLSQIKDGSRYNSTNGILETHRENLAFLKIEKYNSQKEASIGFFLEKKPEINSKKTPRAKN